MTEEFGIKQMKLLSYEIVARFSGNNWDLVQRLRKAMGDQDALEFLTRVVAIGITGAIEQKLKEEPGDDGVMVLDTEAIADDENGGLAEAIEGYFTQWKANRN